MSHIDISTCTYSKVLASRSLSKCTSPVNLPLYSKLHNGNVSCRIFDWYLILALNSIGLIQTDWEYKFDPSQSSTLPYEFQLIELMVQNVETTSINARSRTGIVYYIV